MISRFSFWALYPKSKTQKSQKFIKNPKILKYEKVISRTLEILFKWHRSQNNSANLLNMCHIFVFQEILTPLDLLTWVCFFLGGGFSFSPEKFKIVFKKQVHIHFNFIDPKIRIFRDFRKNSHSLLNHWIKLSGKNLTRKFFHWTKLLSLKFSISIFFCVSFQQQISSFKKFAIVSYRKQHQTLKLNVTNLWSFLHWTKHKYGNTKSI